MTLSRATTAVVLSACALAGCTKLDGSTNRAGTGALFGAGTGALIGNAFDNSTTGRIVGGAVGAIAGGTVGAMLDKQERQLREELSGSGATVANTGNSLVVTLPEAITFDTGSSVVHPDYVDEIAVIAGNLRANPDSTVRVIGHTDDVGSTAYNQVLSERRAAAVANILLENAVPAWRVQTSDVGYSQPVASNDTPGGRAQHRRVEIVITPIGANA